MQNPLPELPWHVYTQGVYGQQPYKSGFLMLWGPLLGISCLGSSCILVTLTCSCPAHPPEAGLVYDFPQSCRSPDSSLLGSPRLTCVPAVK